MKKNTLEEYKKAVKAKYDLIKEADVSGLLNNPSPGNIRELCVLALGEKMTKDDEFIFMRFFSIKDGENVVKQIEKFHIDKLRPVGHYLKGKTKDTKPLIIELIAILVDFSPRPYAKFKTNDVLGENREIEENDVSPNTEYNKEPKNPERGPLVLLVNEKAKANNNISFFTKQKKIIFLSIAGLFFAGYTIKDFVFPEKECMEWKGDHYELVDCKSEQSRLMHIPPIPFDPLEFNRKKLEVCDTTTFFKNNRPVVWYSKKDNVVEFFNMDGNHPERTDCELRKITPYMIDKYVPPCK